MVGEQRRGGLQGLKSLDQEDRSSLDFFVSKWAMEEGCENGAAQDLSVEGKPHPHNNTGERGNSLADLSDFSTRKPSTWMYCPHTTEVGLGRAHGCAYGPTLDARHQRPPLDVWGVAGAAALPDAVLPGCKSHKGSRNQFMPPLTAGTGAGPPDRDCFSIGRAGASLLRIPCKTFGGDLGPPGWYATAPCWRRATPHRARQGSAVVRTFQTGRGPAPQQT